MSKANYQYQIILTALTDKQGQKIDNTAISLNFENHDNLFEIIEKIQAKKIVEHDSESIELAIGLKMFGEVLLRNKNNPLFADLSTHFGEFMKKLKSY